MLTLKELYGDNIFNKESDLYIYGPDGVYVFGPDNIYEGDSVQFETIIFSENEGVSLFNALPIESERSGVEINRDSGFLTTIENDLPDAQYQIGLVYLVNNIRLIDTVNVTIKKRIYPESIDIIGPTRISEETTTFT